MVSCWLLVIVMLGCDTVAARQWLTGGTVPFGVLLLAGSALIALAIIGPPKIRSELS